MPLHTAYRLCPQAVFLPTDFAEYRRVSAMFKDCMRRVSPFMEDRGIDEAYLDLTGVPGESEDIGAELKERVLAATGLTCSIGIAPNKLLAKMASELQKPDGLTVLCEAGVATRIWPLEVRKLPGVGPVTGKRLEQLGVRTTGELAARPLEQLVSVFGSSHGTGLHEAAHGRDQREVVTEREPKSRSRETTFSSDTSDWQAIARTIAALSREVSEDLHEERVRGRTIGLKLRFANFDTVTRDRTLAQPTDSCEAIRRAAFECLSRVNLRQSVRLVGVRVGNLEKASP